MFVPYTAYRETHIRHHAYLNKPNDWELWPYSSPQAPLWFRRLYVWFDLFVGFLSAPIVYGRIYFHRDSPLKTEQRKAVIGEYLAMIVFWGALIGLTARYGAWQALLLVWFVPLFLAGIYQNGRKLTEHLGMQSYDPLLGTRTVVGNSLVTRLCTFLNFDIFVHGPHHRHPKVSHDQLEELTRKYASEAVEKQLPIFTTYLDATKDMVRWMFLNPGVGVNVGAEAPEVDKAPEVDNFLTDVTEEVLQPTTKTFST